MEILKKIIEMITTTTTTTTTAPPTTTTIAISTPSYAEWSGEKQRSGGYQGQGYFQKRNGTQ
jgi:phenylpyruvate tautomerase PptA (4-oxalocrotonate tautomerase family)